MGEGRLTDDASPTNRRLTVPQAAAHLGMTEAAIRGRIKRETLRSERESGTVYVLLEGDEPPTNRDEPPTNRDESSGKPTDQSERVEDLREQVAYLREQLDREREARTEERRRHDTIIAQLSAATAEQARTIRAIEASAAEEPTEDAETVEEAPERVEPRSATRGPQATTERPHERRAWLAPVDKLPWWHYVLGLLSVFLGAFVLAKLSRIAPLIGSWGTWQAIYLGIGILPPSVFGFWVGFRQRHPRLRWEVVRFGALVSVLFFLGLLVQEIRDQLTRSGASPEEVYEVFVSLPLSVLLIAIIITGVPVWVLYVSGVLLGNAWQRHRTRRITGTTPISPLSHTPLSSADSRTDWTPRKQAYVGFAGTVIGALISSLIGTLGAG